MKLSLSNSEKFMYIQHWEVYQFEKKILIKL